MADRAHVLVRHQDGRVVVEAAGQFDYTTAGRLREAVLDAVGVAAGGGVAVDLSAVVFMDSVGLSALVVGFKAAHAADVPFAIAGASPFARHLLVLTGLASLWGLTGPGAGTPGAAGSEAALTPAN